VTAALRGRLKVWSDGVVVRGMPVRVPVRAVPPEEHWSETVTSLLAEALLAR